MTNSTTSKKRKSSDSCLNCKKKGGVGGRGGGGGKENGRGGTSGRLNLQLRGGESYVLPRTGPGKKRFDREKGASRRRN